MLRPLASTLFTTALLVVVPCSVWAQTRQTAGWLERVRLSPEGIVLHAKLDTGADNPSIHALNLEKFTRDDEQWVRFKVVNRYGQKVAVERKVVDKTRVKRHGRAKPVIRPVIELGLCLGDTYMDIEVNLTNRGNFDYPLLIGRSFLAGHFIIDPSLSYIVEPNCKQGSAQPQKEPARK
jgi:hypothetical protein